MNASNYLDIYLDQHMSLKQHILFKARTAAYWMHNLRKIRKYIDKDTALKLANSLIFSHMGYANALFVNLPKSTLLPLQHILTQTANIVLGESRSYSSSQALKDLHVFPVHIRAEYKILILVFKCLH